MNISNDTSSPGSALSSSASKLTKTPSYSNSVDCGSAKKPPRNLVLSTSFVSTKRLANDIDPSPTSPLQSRQLRSRTLKTLLSVKAEINQLQQELSQAYRRKDDAERARDATASDIFTGEYSTDHLQKHSMRIKKNTQIRELDTTIKRLDKQISDLKRHYEEIKEANEIRSPSDGDESISVKQVSSETPRGSLSRSRSKSSDTGSKTIDEESINELSQAGSSVISEPYRIMTDSGDERIPTSIVPNDSSETKETATWLVSDFMQSLQETNISADFLVEKSNGLIDLLKKHPQIRQDLVLSSFLTTLQDLLLNENQLIASLAYRICRYLINGKDFIKSLIKLRITSFLIISLAKENSYQIEREQALKLIRSFIEYNTGLTKGLVQALISCVERQDDPLRIIALETLLELCFVNPSLIRDCHGMRVLVGLLQDYSSFSLASIVLDSILQLTSTHKTRKYLLEDFNISVLNTAFSDTNTKLSLNVEKMQNSCLLISRVLKNDNGFMLYSMNNFKPIKELLSFIQVPICAQYIIDVLLDALRIKPLPYRSKIKSSKLIPSQFAKECLPINQHIALLIMILDNSNFPGYMTDLIHSVDKCDINPSLLVKCRYLLTEYFNLKMNLVDIRMTSISKPIPKDKFVLFQETFEFNRITSQMNKNRNTLGLSCINYETNMKNFSHHIKENTLVHEIDELRFRKMVYDSKVLQTKDFTLWNWNTIQELLEGPLMNTKQLEELAKSTKFIRRLLVFYRPMRLRFSNVDKGTRLAQKYIHVGCKFFKMLTTNPEGVKILKDDSKIIPQVASSLFKAMEGNTVGNIFNENALKTKIVQGYFKFIGVLTQSVQGVKILSRWNFFTVIYKMFDFDSKIGTKFLLLILPELDLHHSSHCCTIIGKALVVSNEKVRMKATRHIGERLKELLKSKTFDNISEEHEKLRQFKMEMLTRQLYDLSPNVVAIADEALYECIVDSDKSKEFSISFKTFLNQMVFIRSPILFELLSKPYGFQLLNEINFVYSERESWLSQKNKEYVSIVENFLAKKQNSFRQTGHSHQNDRLPLHFYGSLSKTEDGITLLSRTGDLVRFMNVIKRYVTNFMEDETLDEILEVKESLWCCGFIGSTELGIGLLDNYSLVENIVQISYHASVTSVKFTAFYVLGLISKTKEGCEILDELGWNCCLDVKGEPVGITLPTKLDKFLSYKEKEWSMEHEYKTEMIEIGLDDGDLVNKVSPIEFNLDHLLTEQNLIENTLNDDENDPSEQIRKMKESIENKQVSESCNSNVKDDEATIIEKVVTTVSQLGNHILSSNAINEITQMNNRYGPKLFENEKIFTKVMEMMEKFRFKPHVRKFLCDLFINKKTLESIILSARKEEKIRK
ncbi:TORC2 complex subunit TSC11 NDAI_0A01710 [Naumovozyma dairenensis CBS 421]|uniref:REM-1 domain-containing protein n=1 Tax=Naumovozyma dairenensis (strain ATCC 10597 / BCRC 20456 / CBS 421 / NBRC 0211 / NRRL Y-12639) TaxID=1071378 RepID=G0W3E1_NAUDC|nr:hypothetical protein NDAI_0A01710 [Naumovozyma dairenensis CBS 421]CCD22329.1 hypothetical protein NDAI_0A01710 [Naumovozyma dairenensis CBS 421]